MSENVEMSKFVVLTNKELGTITSALNHYWHDAHDHLNENKAKRPLGDIEKKMYEQRVEFIKPLLNKLDII